MPTPGSPVRGANGGNAVLVAVAAAGAAPLPRTATLRRLETDEEAMLLAAAANAGAPVPGTGTAGRTDVRPKALFFVLLMVGCVATFAILSGLAPAVLFDVEKDVGVPSDTPLVREPIAAPPADDDEGQRGEVHALAEAHDEEALTSRSLPPPPTTTLTAVDTAPRSPATSPSSRSSSSTSTGNKPPQTAFSGRTVKLAIMADAGLNEASLQVLRLVKKEGADAVLHQGDLDYVGKADAFFARVDAELGPTFPYFILPGNYESKRGKGRTVAWEPYFAMYRERMKRYRDTRCAVFSSRVSACAFRDTFSFVTSAIGVNASRLTLDLRELHAAQRLLWNSMPESSGANGAPRSAAATTATATATTTTTFTRAEGGPTFRFCAWHLPLQPFQIGFREGVPWMSSPQLTAAYESCRVAGAGVLTGHEHYYVRSHTITRYAANASNIRYEISTALVSGTIWGANSSRAEVITLAPGSGFALVSGLGGHSVSVPSLGSIQANPHLAGEAVHPHSLVSKEDPGGKIFYPEITGALDETETSSRKIRGTFPPGTKAKYPFGALFCTLTRARTVTARGVCYFKTISGEVVDRFVLQRGRSSPAAAAAATAAAPSVSAVVGTTTTAARTSASASTMATTRTTTTTVAGGAVGGTPQRPVTL